MGLYFSVPRDLRVDFRKRYLDASSNIMLDLAFQRPRRRRINIKGVFALDAFYHGYDEVIEYMSFTHGLRITYEHAEQLARGGHLELLKVYIPSFGRKLGRFVRGAASGGHVHIIEYLKQKYGEFIKHFNMQVMSGASVLSIPKYLTIRKDYPIAKDIEFTLLANHNRMDIITTLRFDAPTRLTGIEFHTIEDRIPLLNYCKRHNHLKISDAILARRARLDQIMWARENCVIFTSKFNLLHEAIRHNSVEVCKLFMTGEETDIKSKLSLVVRLKGPFWQEKAEWLEKL